MAGLVPAIYVFMPEPLEEDVRYPRQAQAGR